MNGRGIYKGSIPLNRLTDGAIEELVDQVQDGLTLPDLNTQQVVDAALVSIRNGVPTLGNDLNKLYSAIQAINAIIGGTLADGDSLVNTVSELLSVFSTYPEGVDLVTTLAGKLNASASVNTLTETTTGKVLDARQGVVLKALIDALSTSIGQFNAVLANKLDYVRTTSSVDTLTAQAGGPKMISETIGGTTKVYLYDPLASPTLNKILIYTS